jgi:hypothetical protein
MDRLRWFINKRRQLTEESLSKPFNVRRAMLVKGGKVLSEYGEEPSQRLHHFRERGFERLDRPKHRSEALDYGSILLVGEEWIRFGRHAAKLFCRGWRRRKKPQLTEINCARTPRGVRIVVVQIEGGWLTPASLCPRCRVAAPVGVAPSVLRRPPVRATV